MTVPYPPVRLDFPIPSEPGVVKQTLPPSSFMAVPLHWHETHTELFRVRRGYALVTVGTLTRILGPEDGAAEVPPFTLHSFGRGDIPGAEKYWAERGGDGTRAEEEGWRERDVEIDEWTVPGDGRKEIFFRNGIGFYVQRIMPLVTATREGRLEAASPSLNKIPSLAVRGARMLAFMSYMDNYPFLAGGVGMSCEGKPNWLGRRLTYGILGLARGVGLVVGWKPWFKEYTPKGLWDLCEEIERESWFRGNKEKRT